MKKLLVLLSSLFLLVTGSATPAFAHAGVVSTSPSQNQELTSMPSEISITFTEELLTISGQEINTLSLTHLDGPQVEVGEIKISGTTLSTTIPKGEYESGVYVVSYRVVSADGHTISGSYKLYLNAPSHSSGKGVTSVEEHEGFFHIHQGHIIQVGVALILIALWWGYRRFTREQEL